MGLVARGPEEDTRQQGSGGVVGAPPAHATGVVHHDATQPDGSVVHHVQTFEAGHLVDWRLTDQPGPWALVRAGDPLEPCPTTWATAADVASTSVRVGEESFVMPPLDDLPNPAMDALEFVPDATARLRFELWGSPVGRIVCDIRYQDGRRPMAEVVDTWAEVTSPGEPAHDAPEMQVGMTFANYLMMRTGEKTALEAIADRGDVGDTRWTMLLLLHGLVQSPPYVAAYRGLPVLPAELGWWGEAAPFVAADRSPVGT